MFLYFLLALALTAADQAVKARQRALPPQRMPTPPASPASWN